MSTIERALGLLEHFSSQTPEIGLSDFKRLTDFDKGTTHRYLTALKECGFLEQNPSTKAYRLGPAVIRLSAVREKTVPLVQTVAQYVDELAAELHELVHAAAPQARGMSMLYAVDGGNSATRVAFDEAEILPFYATSSGIAQLAYGPATMVEEVMGKGLERFTRHTPQNHEAVDELIGQTRARGYASVDESYEADVCSVAVPFFDTDAMARGTLAIATPAARMTEDMRRTIITRLTQTSQALTKSLGGRVPSQLLDIWPPV
ncbi:MAG: IclR family transcriptional regulator [Marinovum sp.]|nr:IclR family transcriptional regulator [Marinovum sp.]